MARAALRPVNYDDRLSLVEHLDELRTRLIICLAAFLVCFGVAFWQNHALLEIMNRPLEKTAFKGDGTQDPFEKSATYQQKQKLLYLQEAALFRALAADDNLSAESRAMLRRAQATAAATAAATPELTGKRPVTLGVGEPFTATFKVAAWAALLLSMPLLLYQAYAFVLPAFSPREREVALPLLLGVPFLFIAGVAFAYYLVLLQARDYYGFSIMVLIAMGGLFQIPVGILAATRLGVITPQQLRSGRRYAIVIIAIIAALLPGQDPVTMLILAAPLWVLYEGSILFASLLDRR